MKYDYRKTSDSAKVSLHTDVSCRHFAAVQEETCSATIIVQKVVVQTHSIAKCVEILARAFDASH